MKKIKFKEIGKSFIKHAQSMSKNIDRMNAEVLGTSAYKPKSVKKPSVKKVPKAGKTPMVKTPKTVKKPKTQGNVVINIYTNPPEI